MDKREAREILFTLVYEYEFNTDKSPSEIYDKFSVDFHDLCQRKRAPGAGFDDAVQLQHGQFACQYIG